MASSQWVLTVVSTASWFGIVHGGRFLAPFVVSTQQLEEKMLAEMSGHFQSAESERDLAAAEAEMAPMFAALPKNEYGNVNHVVARYALNRYFSHRYSWSMRGLDVDSEFNATTGFFRPSQSNLDEVNATAASSPLPISSGTVSTLPKILQQFMDRFHNGHGLNLRGLAVVAAALDETARQDEVDRLGTTYGLFRWNKDAPLTGNQATRMLDAYMVLYNNVTNLLDWTVPELRYVLTNDTEVHDTDVWENVHPHMQEVRARMDLENHVDSNKSLDFTQATRIVINYGHTYGAFYSRSCYSMKHTLLGMEGRKAGRVRLSDFYNATRYSDWAFNEHIDYLRAMGALDESNASNPQVIVANYVTSQPQCMQASALYDICCPSECEPLMREVEAMTHRPQEEPERIVNLLSELPTDTSPASAEEPRQFSEAVLQRLQDIANHHGGNVPIHGRLFGQWMHHAFPRECPFPHSVATTGVAKLEELQMNGRDTVASDEQMDEHIRPDDTCPASGGGGEGCGVELPWNHAEVLMSFEVTSVLESRKGFHSVETPTNNLVQQFMFMAIVAVLMIYSIASRVTCRTKGMKQVEHVFNEKLV